MEWDKSRLIEFLESNDQQQIIVEDTGGAVRLRGMLQHPGERDMCGSILYEATLIPVIEGLEVSLTLHNDFLGIHILADSTHGNESALSCAAEISYKKLAIYPG